MESITKAELQAEKELLDRHARYEYPVGMIKVVRHANELPFTRDCWVLKSKAKGTVNGQVGVDLEIYQRIK